MEILKLCFECQRVKIVSRGNKKNAAFSCHAGKTYGFMWCVCGMGVDLIRAGHYSGDIQWHRQNCAPLSSAMPSHQEIFRAADHFRGQPDLHIFPPRAVIASDRPDYPSANRMERHGVSTIRKGCCASKVTGLYLQCRMNSASAVVVCK